MRKIKIYGLLTCVCLMMQSCLFNEDDIFDESSAQRAIASVNECQEILKGAANGWLLEYYTGEDGEYGGFNVLARFEITARGKPTLFIKFVIICKMNFRHDAVNPAVADNNGAIIQAVVKRHRHTDSRNNIFARCVFDYFLKRIFGAVLKRFCKKQIGACIACHAKLGQNYKPCALLLGAVNRLFDFFFIVCRVGNL